MALRDILILPDPQLRIVSAPVVTITLDLLTLADDMLETMYKAPGIGLAAIQVGVPKRLVVVDVGTKNGGEPDPVVYINPEITWASEELSSYEEGCLSIPEYLEEVERPAHIKVRYMDKDGKTIDIEADGILATCLQHEIDHLDGVLFIDHISKLKRDMVTKKFKKRAGRTPVPKAGIKPEPSKT